MQNNDKKYFIPVNGTPIEVSEEIYRAYCIIFAQVAQLPTFGKAL